MTLTIESKIRPKALHKFLARSKAYGTVSICSELNCGRIVGCYDVEFFQWRSYTLTEFRELFSIIPESLDLNIILSCEEGTWNEELLPDDVRVKQSKKQKPSQHQPKPTP